MTIHERREAVRAIAGKDQEGRRYVVIPNDAPAYQHQGAWGLYDVERCQLIAFGKDAVEVSVKRVARGL